MGQVAIPHVVGTVALILIFFMVGTFFQNVYVRVQTQVVSFKLREIANHISSDIVDIVSLCFLSEVDQNLTKSVELPSSIYNNLYTVEISTFNDPVMEETIYVVKAYLTMNPSIYGQSELPWTADSVLNIDVNASSISVSSGGIIILCQKASGHITIGLMRG